MSVNRKAFFVLAPFLMIVALIFVNAVPALEPQDPQVPEIRITSTSDSPLFHKADQPDVAIDSKGNVHIVYFDGPDHLKQEIWYTMLANNGDTLIDDTQITYSGPNRIQNKHPTVVVDSYDMVHIVWRDTLSADPGGDLSYSKLDPYDQDGNVADPEDILVKDRIRITEGNAKFNHPRMAVDSNGDIHIVWEEVDGDVYYMKIDNDINNDGGILSGILIEPTSIRSLENVYGRPHIAVDSDNNVHIAWNDDKNTFKYAIYYMMLNGSNGDTLIDATRITPNVGKNAKRQSIVIDSEDKVHIIWHDHRGDAAEIYYTKLDPSLDDQDGYAADPEAITLIDDTLLTEDDGKTSKNPQSAISIGRNIHIAYYEETALGTDVFFMIIDTDGNVVEPVTALTENGKVTYTTEVGDNQPNLDVDANGKAHIVWCDERDGIWHREIYYTTYQGPSGSANTPEQDVQAAIVALSELLTTGDHKTDKKIEKAIKHIEKSLAPKLWESDSTLTKKGKKVFDEDKKAVKHLQKLIKDKKVADEDKNVCKEVIDKLVTADKLLAETALKEAEEAIAAGGSEKEIDKALKEIDKVQKEMEKAQKELDHTKKDGVTLDPKYDKAIDHYKKAWEHAQHAMKKLSKPE